MLFNQSLPPCENCIHLNLEYCFHRASRDADTENLLAVLVRVRDVGKFEQLPRMINMLEDESVKFPSDFLHGLIGSVIAVSAETSVGIERLM